MTLHGIPKLGDFGLAKRIVARDDRPRAAGGDAALHGRRSCSAALPASPASDVYALGVCYFQMLTRQLPFTARS